MGAFFFDISLVFLGGIFKTQLEEQAGIQPVSRAQDALLVY